jgi:hypothetical protein
VATTVNASHSELKNKPDVGKIAGFVSVITIITCSFFHTADLTWFITVWEDTN